MISHRFSWLITTNFTTTQVTLVPYKKWEASGKIIILRINELASINKTGEQQC